MVSSKMRNVILLYGTVCGTGVLFGWRSLYAVFRRDAIIIIALAFLRDQPAVVELIHRLNGEYSIIFL